MHVAVEIKCQPLVSVNIWQVQDPNKLPFIYLKSALFCLRTAQERKESRNHNCGSHQNSCMQGHQELSPQRGEIDPWMKEWMWKILLMVTMELTFQECCILKDTYELHNKHLNLSNSSGIINTQGSRALRMNPVVKRAVILFLWDQK